MSAQSVLVTYSAPQVFLSSDHWKQFQAAFLSQLPLRNVHWKSGTRPSIRTIQELNLELVALDTVRDEQTSQIPLTILERPLLNLYIVTCEDNEMYKNAVKKQIKDWQSSIIQRKSQEWLILHLVRPDTKAAASRFYQVKSSVSDKIKADFNVDKRDRCVQVAWSAGYENPAVWAELVSKIKEGLLSAFDSSVVQKEEEVRRSENQRQMPGWNFCTFFILKESLASSFKGVGLFEDALLQYDELEASFFQVLREKNLSWFGTLISVGPNDDSMPLLSTTKKPYRDLILANTISVFDFRVYMIACQCTLLGNMGKVVDAGRKSAAFLSAFGIRLLDTKETIPDYFVESWIYSSALSVVEQCDTWAAVSQLDDTTAASFSASKGELIELARHQLDTIGIKTGHLPLKPPFTTGSFLSLEALATSDQPTSLSISQTELISSINDKETFYDLYIRVTNRAIELYAKAGRRKFALKLHVSLAALDVHRGRLGPALQTYTSLPAHYAPHKWSSLEALMLSNAMDTHSRLEKVKDGEWIHILLAFLKTYVDGFGEELLIQEDDKRTYLSGLIDSLKDAVQDLTSDLPYSDHPMLSIRVTNNDAKIAETEDGSFIDIEVLNRLSCDVPADEVSVVLTGRDSGRLRYTSRLDILPAGTTALRLFCAMPSHGTYLLDSSEIRFHKLLLQWSHASTQTTRRHKAPVLIHVPTDLRAFEVRVRQPDSIELGSSPSILVSVSTGRNHVSEATLKLSSPSGVQFRCQETDHLGKDNLSLQLGENSISFTDIENDTTISFLVPHSDSPAFHALTVVIEAEYVTSSEPPIKRVLHLTRVVPTSLPVAVNVQDFFRGTRLFSKFTISTTSHQFIRIRSIQLSATGTTSDELQIELCASSQERIVTITPMQPANFLFQLVSKNGPVRDPLRLSITYRMLRDEVEILAVRMIDELVSKGQISTPYRDILVDAVMSALGTDSSWIESYIVTGKLNVPDIGNEQAAISTALSQIRQGLRENSVDVSGEEWREIRIPVDIPQMSIIAAARIFISSNPFATISDTRTPLYAGQPISATLTITTSFHWGAHEGGKNQAYRMRFDVEERIKEWLVSGRKRGDFIAMDGATYTVPITLLALHHGELLLPKVAVTPLPIAGEFTMGTMALPSTETYQVHGAERVLVLPRGGRSTFIVDMDADRNS